MMRGNRYIFLAPVLAGIAVLGLTLTAPASVARAAGSGEALLKKIAAKNAAIKTLKVTFDQTKESALFASSLDTKGVLYFARPGKLRWEYTEKPRSVLVVNGDLASLRYPDLGKTETFDRRRDPSLGALFDQLFVWLGASDPTRTAADYVVTLGDGPATLVLTPRTDPVKKALASVTVRFDPVTLLSKQVELLETTGDRTVIRFSVPTTNGPLADSLFAVSK